MPQKNEEEQAIGITSISPTTITAGTFDTLFIRGTFTSEWDIVLRNVETDQENYFYVPQNHILLRTDTLIKIIVPCLVMYKNINHPEDKKSLTVGTGKVAIKKGNTLKKSSQILTVNYAQQTYAENDTTSRIYKVRLAKNTPNGDFSFWLHPSLRNNNPARQLTKQVIEQWRCASGVNFTIACDSTSAVPLDLNDDISTLSIAAPGSPLYNSVTYASASTRKKIQVCATAGYAKVSAIDMVFRDHPAKNVDGVIEELDWYYNGYTSGAIYLGQQDFYTAILHEFGHAPLLGHVNKSSELMNTYSKSGSQGINHTISPTTDLVAAASIMQLSTSDTTNVCLSAMHAAPPANCALPTCANIGCTSPGYPLQVSFNLLPEHCLNNQDYLTNNVEGSWYQMVGTYATIIAKDQSMGNIVSRQWTIDSDNELFDNIPCNELSTLPDTCRSLYWTLPGNKNINLTVTDANGCTASYQQTITVQANCTLDLPITTSSHLICNPDILGCGSNQNIQLLIADLSNLVGSGCFRYAIEYNATDPTVSTATQIFTGLDLIPDETTNTLMLNCLQQGYYKISITDEVTTCWAQKIVYLTPPASQLPIIDQYTNLPDAGCSTCTGQIQLLAVNGNTDLSNYTFAWSVCPECNTTTQSNLCAGIYTITATDNRTGCSAVKGITINYDTGGDTNPNGVVTGLHISVEPTVFNDVSNVRIAMPEAGEVTIEVYNLNGVLVKKLVDKVYYTQGEFIIPHNATNLNDGLYVYRLNVCEKQKTDIGIKY